MRLHLFIVAHVPCTVARLGESDQMNLIRVLLADNHQLLHSGIRTILATSEEIKLAAAVTRHEQLRLCYQQHQPDVVLLALNVADVPCADILSAVQQQCPNARIVVLLHSPDEACVQQLMALGAAGVVLKSEAPDKLIEAIEAVVGERPWISLDLMPQLIRPQPAQESETLTERELAVLQLTAAGETDCAVAQRLHITERTVRFHLKNVGHKLETTTRIETVAVAIRRQLIP